MQREDIPIPTEHRLPKTHRSYDEILKLHEEACLRNEAFYLDPQSGYVVFTALYLMQKEICCGSLCRHCPYPELEN